MRNKKIEYFMAKDTRLIMDNFTKVIVNKNTIIIKYTVFRQNLDDETITAIKYSKSKKTMFIYDRLKEYNDNVYNFFIKWAEENEIKCIKLEELEK